MRDSERNSKDEKKNKKRKDKNDKKKGKNIGIKQLKIQAMSKYFKQMNIIFIIKIIITFLFSFSFFIVLIIMEKYYKNILLDFDVIVNEIAGVYKDGFNNLLLLKNITQIQIEYEIEKQKANYYFSLGQDTYSINDVVYDKNNISSYTVNLGNPNNIRLNELKLGNSLMVILNDESIDQNLREKLNELYNGNSCKILFLETENSSNDPDIQSDYLNCTLFWSAILQKGMEQSITQMII